MSERTLADIIADVHETLANSARLRKECELMRLRLRETRIELRQCRERLTAGSRASDSAVLPFTSNFHSS